MIGNIPTRRALMAGMVVVVLVAAATVVALGRGDSSARPSTRVVAERPSTTSTTTPSATTTSTPAPTTSALLPPATTAAPTTTAPAPGPPVAACAPVSELTVEQQAHLVVMVGIDGSSIGAAEMLLGGHAPLGGVFIGSDPTRILADGSLSRLQARTHALVAVDDEGGRVQRIDRLVGPLPSAAQMGAMPVEQVRSLAAARGRQLRARGVTVDFAPVVDLAEAARGGVIGDRSFGTDPRAVTDRAAAFADGLRAAGVIPTLKHFPGHGSGQGDSHSGTVSTPPLSSLQRSDLVPYAELAGPGAGQTWVMMGHLDVPGLTEPGRPASLSPAAHRYLRDEVGFRGLIVTDELGGMRAVSSRYSAGRAAVLALGAGSDLVLYAKAAQGPIAAQAIEAAVRNSSLPASRLTEAASRVREAQGC